MKKEKMEEQKRNITYIIPDTHDDGSLEATVELIHKELPNTKIEVFSTGDHLPYSGWLSQEMEKVMKEKGIASKTEARKLIEQEQPQKVQQYWKNVGKRVEVRADFLDKEKYVSIETILGNSDKPVSKNIEEAAGIDPLALFNDSKSLKFLEGDAQIRYKGKTLFLLIPHIPELSKYSKEEVREKYETKIKKICDEIKRYCPEKIVILSHETPVPEKVNPNYDTEEKRRGRVSEGHEEYINMYISQIKQLADPKSVLFIHGHLHDKTKKYKHEGIDMLNLGPWDVLQYNYDTGEFKVKKVKK